MSFFAFCGLWLVFFLSLSVSFSFFLVCIELTFDRLIRS